MNRNRQLRCAFFVVLSACIAGCTAVAPWERGTLAKPHMVLDPNPMQSALSTHIYSSREAASGGDPAEGGGCGCY